MLDPSLGVGWRCIEETDLSGKNNAFIRWYLEATTSFKCCGFVWIGVGGPCVGPVVWFWSSVSVCFLRSCFPPTQHKSPENFLNTSHHQCTVTILYLIPQFSHSLCLVNVHFPQVKKVLRTMAQALDPPVLKRQTDSVGVFPVWLLWTPNLHLSLSVEILVMEHWVPASVFLPGGTRAPEVQTVSITVRWSQWSRNPG